jgi:signal transduction histidine kinase
VVFGRIAAGLAHDLRHPILNIENNSRLLLKRADEAESRERFVRIIARELAEIHRFLDDLHDVAHPIPLQAVRLDLRREVAGVVELFEEETAKQGVKICCHLGEAAIPVWADKFALGRVVKNLIRNAMEAMPSGGTLTIGVAGADFPDQAQFSGQDVVSLTVADTGCGIPPERLPLLFSDFVTTKRRGLGLGLAIAKKILEELGGTLTVRSVVGHGSVFTLTLRRTG